MQQEFRILAEALGSSLKRTCRSKGLDVEMAASRHVADRILYNWRAGFGGMVKMVKGGSMYDQHLRPTSDLDLVTPLHLTETELQKGFGRIAEALRAEGIAIDRIKIKQLDAVGGRDPFVRVVIQGKCGTLRGNTHVDITSVSGPFASPQRRQLPSLLPKRFPGAVVHVQPLAAAAAEKWLAVLTQRDDDFRAKHALDLLSFDEMGVQTDEVAVELLRTLRHRRLPLSTCAPMPKTLEWISYLLRADSWARTAEQRKIEDLDLWHSFEKLNDFWSRTHRSLTKAVVAEVRRVRTSETTLIDRLNARQAQSAPTYRPPQPTF